MMIGKLIGTMTKGWFVKSIVRGVEMAFRSQNRYRYDGPDNHTRSNGRPKTTHVPIDTPSPMTVQTDAIGNDMDYMDISDAIDGMGDKTNDEQNVIHASDHVETSPSPSPRDMQNDQDGSDVVTDATDVNRDADDDPIRHYDEAASNTKHPSDVSETSKARIAMLQERLAQTEEAQRKAAAYAEHMKHDLANYKRRSEEEQERKRIEAISDIGKVLMPIIDDFERIIEHYRPNGGEQTPPVISGCVNIHKKLLSSLERLGIEQIDPTGEEYDPDIAMAMSHEEVEGVKSNTVFVTYQKGYKIGKKIIRSATVGVAR